MVIMDNYYPDRLTELWSKIDKLHLKYLDVEESPEKIEIRNRLEDFIRDYLCMASHDHRFTLPATYEVLYRSANNKPDFSAYKAATGFDALQLYAGNLVSQPWRKEYKRIRKYSGFYKHHIESNLVNAEFLLEAMGYKSVGVSTLILDGPIGPDKVIAVSKDCLIAYVECQLVKAIWEDIADSKMNISWLEIIEFRKTHLCSPEQSIRGLKMKYQQNHYQEHIRNNSMLNLHHVPQNYSNHNILPLSHEHITAPILPQYIYGSNGCCQNNCVAQAQMQCQPYPSAMPYSSNNIMKPQFNTNGYYYANGVNTHVPSYNNSVPIAQLIEVESQGGYDMLDRASHSRIPLRSHNFDMYAGYIAEDTLSKENRDSDKTDSQCGDWDYVYKTLENQGYNKDLGDRGDVLNLGLDGKSKQSSSDKKKREKDVIKKPKTSNLEVNMNALTLSNKSKTPTEKTIKPKKTDPKSLIEVSPASSYDNLTPQDKKQLKTSNLSVSKTKTPNRDKIVTSKQPTKGGKSKTDASWDCKKCTYLNSSSSNICEMCSKSRSNVEEEIEVGGAECEKCTLVNPKDVSFCQACNESLENSPTRV